MTSPGAFKSFYNDSAYGAQIEAGTDLTKWDTLKGAFFYRRDIHTEYQLMYNNRYKGNPAALVRMTTRDGAALQRANVDRHTGHLLSGG